MTGNHNQPAIKTAFPIHVLVVIVCSLFFSSGLSANTKTNCKPEDLERIQIQNLALASIAHHFQELAQGNPAPDFTLASVFTIDLLDKNDVRSRVEELKLQPAKQKDNGCQAPDYLNAKQQRDEYLNNIARLRLSYLTLSLEARQYLNTLVSVNQRLLADHIALTQALDELESNLQALAQRQADWEQAFKTQQDPKARATLSENILNLDKEREKLLKRQERSTKAARFTEQNLALSSGLLQTFHLTFFNQSAANRSTIQAFTSLVTRQTLQRLIWRTQDKFLFTPESLSDLAALFIIHSRIFKQQRDQGYGSGFIADGFADIQFNSQHEFKTLLALPAANLHLKLTNQPNNYAYLSRNIAKSATSFASQLVIIALLVLFLKRIPLWVNAWQRFVVKHYLAKKFARLGIAILRILQPNAAWLSAMLFYLYLQQLDRDTLRDLILLYDVTAIIAFYLLVNTLTVWAIGNTNNNAHLFVLRSKQQLIASHCHRYALYITAAILGYIILNHVLNGGIICNGYFLLLIFMIWLFSYHLIKRFEPEFETHLSKRFSDQTLARIKRIEKPVIKQAVLPWIFLYLQLNDFVTNLHQRLLHFERYQALTAKFLKIRLEQSQASTEATEKPSQDDVHYESWFLNRDLIHDQPGLIIHSPWVKEIDKVAGEWFEDKHEENDLVLIGECGIGKSILIKQWIEHWDKCTTIYLKIPEKTTTADALFSLVMEALDLKSIKEIAQFVTAQKDLPKTVIVIDEAQNLFLSDVGCFDGYKMLQSLISAKLDNIFWIVSFNHQSWIYLNDVFSRTYQFSSRINVHRWSQQEIRDLILARHRASGRRLSYDELLLASTAHSETAARAADSRCFSLLWDQSAGIPAVALSIWANSARKSAGGRIEMGVPERPTNSVMQTLSDDHLFVYAALVIHETLNTQQAHAVTHLPEAIVRRALKLGLDQGFLIRKTHGRYTINSLWYLQLCQLLKRKNFLHE